ncbi:hypothetical protein [Mesorhizobium sp. KR2-14]|uniref:hypothetical protein n=1 Tax=Mesorhizobium sp. KR2-14 TaxID=3156610 RepID=UPI0032B310D8
MKALIATVAACCLMALTSGPTFAACPDRQAGISKDGTHAPLETPQRDAGKPAQKTGDTMPLASKQGGGNKDLATSQQDVESQQKHGKTAAAQADQNNCKD